MSTTTSTTLLTMMIVNSCRNIGAEREKQVLDGIEEAFRPFVKDRGLDWEIHIEQMERSTSSH